MDHESRNAQLAVQNEQSTYFGKVTVILSIFNKCMYFVLALTQIQIITFQKGLCALFYVIIASLPNCFSSI